MKRKPPETDSDFGADIFDSLIYCNFSSNAYKGLSWQQIWGRKLDYKFSLMSDELLAAYGGHKMWTEDLQPEFENAWKREYDRRTLLRASPVPSDTLLRPASDVSACDGSELLRGA